MAWLPMPDIGGAAVVNGAGTATIPYRSPSPGQVRITQISVSIPGTQQGIAQVLKNGVFILGTAAGWADTSSGDPPIYVAQGDALAIVFTGAVAGCTCYAVFMGEQEVR